MEQIWEALNKVGFKVSTDTRKDVSGSVFFCLKGENFDANEFVQQALDQGASAVVTENEKFQDVDRVIVVDDSLQVLQTSARRYRDTFNIPVVVIGGSNGKTTTKELTRDVLSEKYSVHCSQGNFNNSIGVPLSVLAMPSSAEIAVFEVGANHSREHLELLDIINPTHVLVTNNGMDHLEGFLSPEGARLANKEIFDWAGSHGVTAFVNRDHADLGEDSAGLEKVLYTSLDFQVTNSYPLAFSWSGDRCETKLFGQYNIENIAAAASIGQFFEVDNKAILNAISKYEPGLKRSQIVSKGETTFIMDCYNANPTSMSLALESFSKLPEPRGVILGDMLELGRYAGEEHIKVVREIEKLEPSLVVFIGGEFKRALVGFPLPHHWFPDSLEAGKWLAQQDLKGYTILLKGSRGVQVERAII